MSTEPIDSPEMAKKAKKHKKNKGHTDNETKKRKREVEEEIPERGETKISAPETFESTSKKRKKEKSDTDKRSKKKHRDEKAGEGAEVLQEARANEPVLKDQEIDGGDAVKPKKKKKRRRDDAQVESEDGVTAQPSNDGSKEHGEGEGEPKKHKKKRKRDESLEQENQDVAPKSQVNGIELKKQKKAHKKDKSSKLQAEKEPQLLAKHSPFIRKTASLYLALSPCAYSFPLEGLCAEHISPLILTYHPPLGGVVLGFQNPRMSEYPDVDAQATTSQEMNDVLAQSINEYAVSYVWLTVDFTLFQPRQGTWLQGRVTLQNESLLAVVCYNYFNAVIARETMPNDWQWVEAGEKQHDAAVNEEDDELKEPALEDTGHFIDGKGNKVEGMIVFRVDDFEASPGYEAAGGSISIAGTLLPEGDET